MSYELKVKILKGERWYGGSVAKGFLMPFSRLKVFANDTSCKNQYNQSSPLYISNKGRFIWSENGFKMTSILGTIKCTSNTSEIKLYEGYENLRGAYLEASKRFFPADGTYPNETMFKVPQYCTWIELQNNQTQKGILDYAESIIKGGMPAGEIIIDDGWQVDFGVWEFDPKKFENAKEMIDTLHKMGFHVIMWICPFVSKDSKHYSYLVENNLLVKDSSGNIAMRKWWNGVSAVLDLSNPNAMKWFTDTCYYLMNELGVDGFKQDAGDSDYYRDDDITFGKVAANDQCEIWAKSAKNYDFNELRACWKCGGMGIAQRLSDKSHMWNAIAGLRSLIPNAQLQGILGYPFTCPDMIGGGQVNDFKGNKSYDHELFVRYSEVSALMPMMQYSFSLWRLDDKKTAELCRDVWKTHVKYSDYIIEMVKNASKTGEPIIRYMEYEFPNEKMYKAKQQFMLGDKYLVAPQTYKGRKTRTVLLPKGKWLMLHTNQLLQGGGEVTIDTPLDLLPVFERVE